MILIVNLNLAVDEIVELEGLTVGDVHRTTTAERLPGGKGVNAARVLKALGEPAILTGFLGGRAGDFIARALESEGLSHACVAIQTESRTCIILNDTASRTQTVINEAGPQVSAAEQTAFLSHYARLLSSADVIVISGSLPPGLQPDFYAGLIQAARDAGKPVLLDTSAEPLRESLKARPFVVKINGAEAGALLGLRINGLEEAVRAARRLIESGARHAMITLGAEGAALNFGGAQYLIKPPRVDAINSVGSGDAVAAGLGAAIVRGLGMEETVRLAMACGAANALRGAGRCREEEIYRLTGEVEFVSPG